MEAIKKGETLKIEGVAFSQKIAGYIKSLQKYDDLSVDEIREAITADPGLVRILKDEAILQYKDDIAINLLELRRIQIKYEKYKAQYNLLTRRPTAITINP